MEKPHRRRGQELENAILNATWKMLLEKDYANITMDDISKAAHTNKNTIYRRWKTKLDVIGATLEKNVVIKKLTLPNTGSLREDLIELLATGIPVVDLIGIKNIKEIARDRLIAIRHIKPFSPERATEKAKELSTNNFTIQYIIGILNQAYDRGELSSNPQTFEITILNLPILLVLAYIISENNYNTQTVNFLVDNILLPVFTAQ